MTIRIRALGLLLAFCVLRTFVVAAPAHACSLAVRTGWRIFEGRALAHTRQVGDPLPAYDWTFAVTNWDEEHTTDPARPQRVVVRVFEPRRVPSASAPTTGTSCDHLWVDVPFRKGARYRVVASQAGTAMWFVMNAFVDQYGPPLQRI